MSKICDSWQIPHINLSEIHDPQAISLKLEEVNPKIILCAIEDLNREDIQDVIQLLRVAYVAIDECQVLRKGTKY